ncbi:iron complex transport system ATP-binding protein [Nocardioides daedukensis]|uniref:Iron complex transport system ATP-binding protein n=1 Tax=Nocardioides daedukensis TaxID=634462 RepID=A0A7Y9S6L3_9ACTN|nr:ABC transporter ATP-binding protein [Nocardioides daedukensis]NYG60365.1 iron complex transport system ATP-binding protein [Nocardioides daedukensis]
MRIDVESVAWQVNGRTIIEDIDLLCEPGTFTGLLGPNGSGKTTLLHVMAGLRRPSRGRVLADGHDLHRMSGGDRARAVALVEQDASTNLDLTVRDVVGLGRIPHRGRWAGAPDDPDAIEVAMELARVSDLAERRWPTLSGGERQRTQLARAVAQRPAVLLLDEPTNHLDLGHQLDFLTRVRELGLTTVAALHDLELALGFCDRLVVLDRGRVVAAGTVDEDVLTPELLAHVYGVDASVEKHPVTGRPHLHWNGPIAGTVHA